MEIEASMGDKVGYCTSTVWKTSKPLPVHRSRVHQAAKIVVSVLIFWAFLHVARLRLYLPPRSEDDLGRHDHNDTVSLPGDDDGFFSARNSSKSYHTPKAQYTFCDHTDSTIQLATEFNVTDEFHFLDLSPPQDARGRVIVQRGSDAQVADIEISITIAYATPLSPDVSSGFNPRSGTMRLYYTSTECVQVSVDISLRPDVRKRMRQFSMVTEMLDLWPMGSLAWTVDNLSLHSAHGRIDYEGSFSAEDPLITYNVSATSVTGQDNGYFVADANLHLRNEAGSIFIVLIPRLYSDIPTALESIDVSTDSGSLDIRVWAEQLGMWCMEPYTHTTQIRSESGRIRASVPLGTLTNYTSETGSIAASVIPLGAAIDDASKDFRTESEQGSIDVHVYNTIQESLKDGKVNPLLSLRSRHQVRDGALMLRYPYSWYGELEGVASDGTLKLDGSRLENVEKGKFWVKATRGEGMSFMESWVHHGNLDIKIGLGPE